MDAHSILQSYFTGIVSNVTLGDEQRGTAVELLNWTTYSMPLNNTKAILKYAKTILTLQKSSLDLKESLESDLALTQGRGSFWYGEFQVPCQDSKSLDTFLKFPNGWRKGMFINHLDTISIL